MNDEQTLEWFKVNELRSITGRDIMSCMKALMQSEWDVKKATQWFSDTAILSTGRQSNK